MSTEQWLPVVGYEGLYEVSNTGHVRSVSRLLRNSATTFRLLPQGVLKEFQERSGYRAVCLHPHPGLLRRRRVHTIVARAFIGERPSGFVVDHIDHDKANNEASNLQYITNRENILRALAAGKFKNRKARNVV